MKKNALLMTFSLNEELSIEKRKKIFKLVDQINDFNRDRIGEAFLKIVEGKNIRDKSVSLNRFAKSRNFYENIDNTNQNAEVSLEEQLGEATFGNKPMFSRASFEEDIISACDTDNIVKEFLELRKTLFIEKGIDIWRLMELVQLDDKIAVKKFRKVVEEQQKEEFFEYLAKNHAAMKKLNDILC